MHALPRNAQLSGGAGLAHIADQLFDFLVMLEGFLTASRQRNAGVPVLQTLSLSRAKGFVAAVAKPNVREAWRVRVDGQYEFSKPELLLMRIGRGWCYRFFDLKESSVVSPEMRD